MKRPTMGGVYLLGRDSDVWSNPNQRDLIALNAQEKNDMFSSWVTKSFIYKYHQSVGQYFRVSFSHLSSSARDTQWQTAADLD